MLSTLRAQYHTSNFQCSITLEKAIPQDGCRVGGAAKCTAGMLGRDGTKGLVGCMILSGECICIICRIQMYMYIHLYIDLSSNGTLAPVQYQL